VLQPQGSPAVDLLDLDGSPKRTSQADIRGGGRDDLLDELLGTNSAETVVAVVEELLVPSQLSVETVGGLWATLSAEVSGEKAVSGLVESFQETLQCFEKQVGLHLVDIINDEAILAGKHAVTGADVFVHAAWKGSHVTLLVVSPHSQLSQQVLQQLERL
jgi:hypothetical protein